MSLDESNYAIQIDVYYISIKQKPVKGKILLLSYSKLKGHQH